jgi:hypothetical protein
VAKVLIPLLNKGILFVALARSLCAEMIINKIENAENG